MSSWLWPHRRQFGALVKFRFAFWPAWIWLAGLGLALGLETSQLSRWAVAQPPTAGDREAPAQAAAAEEDDGESAGEHPIREQTIYIPFAKLRDVFEREGRGVFLPYSEFQKLWDAAREKPPAPDKGPPVGALITQADNEAVVETDVVRVSARLTVELLKKGWLQIPLRLSGVALQSASIDGEPARVLPAAGGGYELLLLNDQAEPRSVELHLEYAKAISKAPGKNSVAFEAPQAPVNRWRIRIAERGVKINVQPLIAASESHDASSSRQQSDQRAADAPTENSRDRSSENPPQPADRPEETVVLALVGAAPEVRIDWTPKAEGAAGMSALVSVQATQEVFIGEGTLRTRTQLRYDISRSALEELTVDVPSDFKIVNVFDANLRKWQVSPADGAQRITAELFEPATTSQNLSIELEKFYDDNDAEALANVDVPIVKAVDVGRQQGMIVVNVDSALRSEVAARTSLLQMDAAELPDNLKAQPWTGAYRYAALPAELRLSLTKVQPRVTVDQFVEATLEPELLAVDLRAKFTIADAGVFQLELELAEDFEVRQVRGQEYPGVAAASIESHRVEQTDGQTRLIISLDKKALGQVGIVVQLEKRLDDANLLSPTGSASTISIPVPRARPESVMRATGRMALYAPESLRINPTETTGLRAISLSEAMSGVQTLQRSRFPNAQPALSFAFTDQSAQLTLSVERRKPHITARQRLNVSVDSGVAKFQSLIIYDILYSGVASLRLDVPAEIAPSVQNTSGSGLRETPFDPQPEDVAAGYVAWRLTGQSELFGRQTVMLNWEQKIDELSVGQSTRIAVPHLRPKNVDRAWGQIVIVKSENLDVQPDGSPTGSRPIDPQHDVMPDAQVAGAARALEFHGDWSLDLAVTRYQLEEVKHTSIERALVRMVATRSSQIGVQALYRIRSARQRLTLKLPSNVEFESQPARINGAPVGLERGDKDLLYLPLSGRDADQPLVLELRYTLEGTHHRFDLPEFPEDPAVQKVYLNVFLPRERTLLAARGPWTEEWTWRSQGLFRWEPQTAHSDDELAAWITEGISQAASPPFQRDGTLYEFSALKPQPPPAGSLVLTTVNDKVLSAIVFALLAALALGLLRSPLKVKIAAIAGLAIAALLVGVLAPSLAQQLVALPGLAGLALVAVAWTAWGAYQAAVQLDRWRRLQPVAAVPVANDAVASDGGEANV